MKLYTRTGDDGSTSLFDGTRVEKDHPRVTAYGAVDETNAALGMAIAVLSAADAPAALRSLGERLLQVQRELFEVGSDLATPIDSTRRDRVPAISMEQVTRLEGWIDEAVAAVRPLKNFILPGGSEAAARLHAARTIARRAEREVITLARSEAVGPAVIPYLNRLNDLLFAWARVANHELSVEDVEWIPPRKS